MADTPNKTKLEKGGTWVDLYADSGIPVGTSVSVQSLSAADISIHVGLSAPTGDFGYSALTKGQAVTIGGGESGLWARSISGGFVQVTDTVTWQPYMLNSDGDTVPSSAIQFLDNVMFVDSFGQGVTTQLDSDISINWANGVLDDQFDMKTPVLTGDGTADASTRVAIAGSASAGSATIQSRDAIRYSNGRGFFAYWTASFNGAGVGNSGPHDDNDGFPLRYDGSQNKLFFEYLDGGTPTGTVELDIAALGIDPNNINIFAVLGGFLGTANPTLLVKKDVWKVAAVIKTEGMMNDTHVNTPAFPMRIKAENGMAIKSGSWHGGTMGRAGKVQDRGFSYPNQVMGSAENLPATARGSLTLVGTAVSTAFILHAKDLFNGFPNKIKADILATNLSVRPSASNGTVQLQLIGNPTLDGNEVFADVSASSVVEIDDRPGLSANGAYVSGGRVIGQPINVTYSGAGGQQAKSGGEGESFIDELQLDGTAGETLAVLIRDLDSNAVTVDWTLTWIERQI